jgi:hypothetical protein
MARTDLLKGVGAFALVLVVIVAATAATGTVLSGQSQPDTVDAPAYDSELVATAIDDEGTVASPDTSETKTVVVDQSHGNAIGEKSMKPLVDALVSSGHDVQFYTGGGDSNLGTGGLTGGSSELNSTLRSADAFVIANPASQYTTAEINGIEAFADAGGRVLMLADPIPPSSSGQSLSLPVPLDTSSGSTTTPGQPTNLAANFGISFGSGYLFDMADNANNYQRVYANPAGDGPLTDGVERLVVTDATPLTTSEEVTSIVESEDVQLSSTRQSGTHSVAVRTGDVAAIGSTDFLAPSSATIADNEAFVGNLAQFLVTGDKEPGAPQPTAPTPGSGGVTRPTTPGGPTTPPTNGTATPTPPTNETSP